MTQVDGLVAWLRKQIDVDERAARTAQGGPWHIGNAVDPTKHVNVHTFPGARSVADEVTWLDAEHIVLQAPDRALREVEAKRWIVNRCEIDLRNYIGTGAVAATPYLVLRLLAAVYADRAGYDGRWRP